MANHETASYGFTLDMERLEEVVLRVYNAALRGLGIFEGGLEKFLPQHSFPPELEFEPKQVQLKDPYRGALFLWGRLPCDRLSSSKYLVQTTLETWNNPDLNWIFQPQEVVLRSEDEVEHVLRTNIKFGLSNDEKEEKIGKRFRDNAQKLLAQYDGDPRNTIQDNTVDQSRINLMEFKGIGTGLANLLIIQLLERKIALPTDPKNAYLKIDRHKAGIAIYTGAIKPTNGEIDANLTVPVLEKEYRRISHKFDLDIQIPDAALWITGSEVCSSRNYARCVDNCVLAGNLCISRVQIHPNTGRYVVLTEDGQRIETRKGRHQEHLFYLEEAPQATETSA